MDILRSSQISYDTIALRAVASGADLAEAQKLAHRVFVEDSLLGYILAIVGATRTEAEFKAGVSVRGGLGLRQAAQARALLYGRDFVLPDDVRALVLPVLAHRLALVRPTSDAREERQAVTAALRRIMTSIPAPA
jgi:MoxR-like ATPase